MARRRDGFTGGLIALVMATVLLPVRPGSAQTNWVSYTPPAGWFQVDMPLMPTASQVQDTSPIGSITTHIFAANEGGATFSVSCSELPTLAVQFLGAQALMEQVRKSICL